MNKNALNITMVFYGSGEARIKLIVSWLADIL